MRPQDVVAHRESARGPPARTREANRKGEPKDGVEGRLIDINSASQQELEALPGIGPVIAKRIIDGRPYSTVDDLRRIKGIGEKRMEEIRAWVKVQHPAQALSPK